MSKRERNERNQSKLSESPAPEVLPAAPTHPEAAAPVPPEVPSGAVSVPPALESSAAEAPELPVRAADVVPTSPTPLEAPDAPEIAPGTAMSPEEREHMEAQREEDALFRELDRVARADPEFAARVNALREEKFKELKVLLRQLLSTKGAQQTLVKPPPRYRVEKEVRVSVGSGIRTLKVGEILDESAMGPAFIRALLEEPKVALTKLAD